MLDAHVILDLPSEAEPRRRAFWHRLRDRFSGSEERGETEELTIAGREAFRRLMWGLDKAGFDNIICALADSEELWLDQAGTKHDLEHVIAKVVDTGALERGFDMLELVASRRLENLHCLVAIRVRNRVPQGEPEFSAQVCTRLSDLRIATGETPLSYRSRVEEFMADPPAFERCRLRVEDVVRLLVRGLERSMGARMTEASPVEARIVVPGPDRVAGFDALKFGAEVTGIEYSARPRPGLEGAYDNPHERHFYDPYHALQSWLMTRAILDKNLWRRPDVKLVHPRGIVLATASEAQNLAQLELDVAADAVTLGESGIATAYGTSQ
jgi:hypothetical protein